MRGAASIALALVLTALAGCASIPDDSDLPGKGEPSFPPRSNDRAKPVLLLHGFNLNLINPDAPSSDPSAWTTMKTFLALCRSEWVAGT